MSWKWISRISNLQQVAFTHSTSVALHLPASLPVASCTRAAVTEYVRPSVESATDRGPEVNPTVYEYLPPSDRPINADRSTTTNTTTTERQSLVSSVSLHILWLPPSNPSSAEARPTCRPTPKSHREDKTGREGHTYCHDVSQVEGDSKSC